VQSVGAVSFRPFLGMGMSTRLDIDGRVPQRADDIPIVGYSVVTPGYLRGLGQPLLKGREFAESDGPESEGVAIINEAMAHRFWPNQDPVGQHIRPGFSNTDVPWQVDATSRWLTIIGVAGNIKEFRLNEQVRPLMYVSYRQFPLSYMFLMVRTAVAPESLSLAVQHEIRGIDAGQPVSNIQVMDDAIANAAPRFNVQLLGLFAALAVFLSAVGVYGVTSYAITQRTQEFGTRMALGARSRDVLAMVIRETLKLSAIGLITGLIAAFLLTRTMTNLLYGVTSTDVSTFAGTALALLAVTLVASYLPARRAAKVDPMSALRTE
jgi:putative ABC transport system permease protein